MKRFFGWLFALPFAALCIIIAIANREVITLSADPFGRADSLLTLDLPLYAVIFGAFFLGLLIGLLAEWVIEGKWRSATRKARGQAAKLSRDLNETKREVEKLEKEKARATAQPAIPANASLLSPTAPGGAPAGSSAQPTLPAPRGN